LFLFLFILLLRSLGCVVVVERGTAVIVERFGKFHRKLDPGIHWLPPLTDYPRELIWREVQSEHQGNRIHASVFQEKTAVIDLRETIMDFPMQTIITRDNVELRIHPMILYKIVDPVRVIYQVYDWYDCVEKLVQTTLRSIVGDMGLDDTLASREEINRQLNSKLSGVFMNWGVKLISSELLEIIPGPAIQEAMHLQISAERIRRAAIISSDGFREQTVTQAEGECQSIVALSKGEQQVTQIIAKANADAKLLKANAEAEAIRVITSALKDCGLEATQYIVALKYIDAFLMIAASAKARTIYFPYEANVLGALNQLGTA